MTQHVALEYRRPSCASENFLLSTCEIESRERRKYHGRASEAVFQFKPTAQRILPAEEHFVEQECRFWSRLSSRLRFLSVLIKRGKGFRQRAEITSNLGSAPCHHLNTMIHIIGWSRSHKEFWTLQLLLAKSSHFRKKHDLRFSRKQATNSKRGAAAPLRAVRRALTLF